MALEDFRAVAMRCNRCSYCKWIPLDRVKSWEFAKGCPSVDYSHFHAYSGGGRLVTLLSLTDGRSEITDEVVDVVYKCSLCGQCDVSCKVCRYDMHLLDAFREFRRVLNEQGHVPAAYPAIIAKLARTRASSVARSQAKDGWAEGLGYQATRRGRCPEGGCPLPCRLPLLARSQPAHRRVGPLRACSPRAVWTSPSTATRAVAEGKPMTWAIATTSPRRRKANLRRWAAAGVKTVVTPCATCYWPSSVCTPSLVRRRSGSARSGDGRPAI